MLVVLELVWLTIAVVLGYRAGCRDGRRAVRRIREVLSVARARGLANRERAEKAEEDLLQVRQMAEALMKQRTKETFKWGVN